MTRTERIKSIYDLNEKIEAKRTEIEVLQRTNHNDTSPFAIVWRMERETKIKQLINDVLNLEVALQLNIVHLVHSEKLDGVKFATCHSDYER